MQINPDATDMTVTKAFGNVSIVSIHADQSRRLYTHQSVEDKSKVSIVSIHADQSRLGKKEESWKKDRW